MSVMATAANAQIVRGTVTEKGSGAPLSGVVLTIVDTAGKTLVDALSGEDGGFEVRAPGPGRFALDAKRIGVRRLRLPAFSLASGETSRIDVVLEAVPTVLASMRVTSRSACVRRPQENARTAELWEDARAALRASVISRLRASPSGKVVRFTRKLDVRTWRVLFEHRREVPADANRPFRSLSAEDLSIDGYVRENADGSVDYFAPDAEVLLSDTFLADHCFRVEPGLRERARHIGLAFEPIAGRKTPDVRGVLWLDATTAELRTLEFQYTWLPYDQRPVDFGGTVDFFRTFSGQWIVRAWRIRTPEFGYEQFIERANGERIPAGRSRTPHVVRITEEGGAVPISVLLAETGIEGTVVLGNGSNRLLPGVTVALGGTTDSAVTDGTGRFAMSGVNVGSYTVVLRHPVLDSLGIEHLGPTVDVRPGMFANLALEFPSDLELATRLCTAVNLKQHAVVRLLAVDEKTGAPLTDLPITLAPVRVDARGNRIVSPPAHRGTLDATGGFMACGIAGNTAMRIEIGPEGAPRWVGEISAPAGVVGWHLIRIQPQ
jgi:hypothetical protein